jgi:hypothetical protein
MVQPRRCGSEKTRAGGDRTKEVDARHSNATATPKFLKYKSNRSRKRQHKTKIDSP